MGGMGAEFMGQRVREPGRKGKPGDGPGRWDNFREGVERSRHPLDKCNQVTPGKGLEWSG